LHTYFTFIYHTTMTQKDILKEYEEQSEILLQKMMHILIRAQRKVDDEAYVEILKKLENLTDES